MLFWARTENGRIPKGVLRLYINLEKTKLRGKQRKGCQVEVSEDGNIVVGKCWQERDI